MPCRGNICECIKTVNRVQCTYMPVHLVFFLGKSMLLSLEEMNRRKNECGQTRLACERLCQCTECDGRQKTKNKKALKCCNNCWGENIAKCSKSAFGKLIKYKNSRQPSYYIRMYNNHCTTAAQFFQ